MVFTIEFVRCSSNVTPLLQRWPRRVAAEPHRDRVDPRAAARPQPRPGQPRHGARPRHAAQTLRAGGTMFPRCTFW